MKTVLFKPESEIFTGEIVLRAPTFDERCDYLDIVQDESAKDLEKLKALVKKSESHYEKIDLKRKEDGALYESFEDLTTDQDCTHIMIQVATKLIGGFKMGKK